MVIRSGAASSGRVLQYVCNLGGHDVCNVRTQTDCVVIAKTCLNDFSRPHGPGEHMFGSLLAVCMVTANTLLDVF